MNVPLIKQLPYANTITGKTPSFSHRKTYRNLVVGMSAAEFQVVDVFTPTRLAGNPTCVCFPSEPLASLSDSWMSKVAREAAQPTTSFVDLSVGGGEPPEFKTFSAAGAELPILSGHSSLGIAAAVHSRTGATSMLFATKYGDVSLVYDEAGDSYEIAMPCERGTAAERAAMVEPTPREPLERALGLDPASSLHSGSVLGGKFLFAEVLAPRTSSTAHAARDSAQADPTRVSSRRQVTPKAMSALRPDIAAIKALPGVGVFVTAVGHIDQLVDLDGSPYRRSCASTS